MVRWKAWPGAEHRRSAPPQGWASILHSSAGWRLTTSRLPKMSVEGPPPNGGDSLPGGAFAFKEFLAKVPPLQVIVKAPTLAPMLPLVRTPRDNQYIANSEELSSSPARGGPGPDHGQLLTDQMLTDSLD